MIETIIITGLSLYALGLMQAEGMLLHGVRVWLDKKRIPSFLRKPLYKCPPCMASIWGSVVWGFFSISFFTPGWPLFCLSVCSVSYILIYLFPYE